MQTFMEIQKNLGQLNQVATTLSEESKKNGAAVEEVCRKVYAAQTTIKVVGSMLAAIGMGILFLLWKIWDAVYPLILAKTHH
jgi:LPS O-antigen subunit length determinant protein (WzzB/FepE family)